jgi:hypothetical protein
MVATESKKRKGIGASKVVAKKQKISTDGPTSAASFVSGSTWAFADVVETQKIDAPKDIGGQRVEGADRPEPSAVNPMPGVLGGDSSS